MLKEKKKFETHLLRDHVSTHENLILNWLSVFYNPTVLVCMLRAFERSVREFWVTWSAESERIILFLKLRQRYSLTCIFRSSSCISSYVTEFSKKNSSKCRSAGTLNNFFLVTPAKILINLIIVPHSLFNFHYSWHFQVSFIIIINVGHYRAWCC